jgi:hypothetical protein
MVDFMPKYSFYIEQKCIQLFKNKFKRHTWSILCQNIHFIENKNLFNILKLTLKDTYGQYKLILCRQPIRMVQPFISYKKNGIKWIDVTTDEKHNCN